MQTVSITPKWQVYIPVSVRKKAKLEKPTQADIYVEKNKIVLRPKKSKILEMAGKYKKLKPVKPINITKIRDYIDYSEW